MMIETVIFDLGGVLIDWNPRYVYRQVFDNEEEMEYFLKHITTSDWNEEQDGGRSLTEATEWLVNVHPDHEENIRMYYGRWEEMLKGQIQETVDIFSQLKEQGKVRLYALTNWSAETFPVALRRFDFLQWFEGILVSGEENLKKPDPKIYELILERYSIERSKAYFIDDNLRNVNAARKLGIRSHHFTHAHLLAEELIELGLLS